nr:DNA adenine methylase [Sulfurospirillum diekertiae]
MYFSDDNAKKIDAIRLKIEEWKRIGRIGASMFFLLASLLESADRVANTASMYGSFLKTLKPTAKATLELKPAYFQINDNSHVVYQEDANALFNPSVEIFSILTHRTILDTMVRTITYLHDCNL